MYTNQPYQQYPPVVNSNYSGNQRLVKSTFARPPVIGMVVSLGIIIAVMVYGLINLISISASAINSLSYSYYTSPAVATTRTIFTWMIIINIIIIAVYLLPFIGLIMMYTKSKNASDFSSPKTGITLNFTFAIINTVIMSIITIIVCIISSALVSTLSTTMNANRSYYSYYSSSEYAAINTFVNTMYFMIFLFIAYCIITIIWSASAIALCSSMKRTLNGEGLFTGGATPLCVCTGLSMGIIVALFISSLVMINSIPGSQYVMGNTSVTASVFANNIPSIISSLAMFVFNIFLIVFATSYKKTINAARAGQSYNNSTTTYYQGPYQDPQNNISTPPYNVQNSQPVNTYYANPQQNINSNPQPTAESNNQVNLNKTPTQNTTNNQPQVTEVICSACGAKNKPESMFCQKCGNNLKAAKTPQSTAESNNQVNLNKNTTQNNISSQTQNTEKICSVCGTKNKSDSMFCQKCGNSLKVADIPQPTAESNNQVNLNKTPTQNTTNNQPQVTEVICSACGAKNKSESTFCQNCGNNLKAAKTPQPTAESNNQLNLNKTPIQNTTNNKPQVTEVICSACGAKNKPESMFCQNCGTRLR